MDEKDPEQRKPRGRWARVGLNLVLMLLVALGLGWLAFTWLDVWTGHGDVAIVPDVSGRIYTVAVEELQAQGFEVEITDSVYDAKARPGYVVDQNPRQNTKVKPGRMIYLTINAMSPKTVTLPRLSDISSRQARAILEGLGLNNIVEDTVISEYEGLVLGVRADGHSLTTGARVPVTARITLEVGSGTDPFATVDSTAIDSIYTPSEHYDLF